MMAMKDGTTDQRSSSSRRKERKILREIVPEYKEELLGLPYAVILRNAVVCKKDAETGELLGCAVPDLDGLAAAVAMMRALCPVKLSPEEIRFIRKTLDVPAKKFAEEIGIDPSTYSRWENGQQVPGEYVERLLRLHVCEQFAEAAPAIDYNPKMITLMRVLSAWPPGAVPLFVLTRVCYKDGRTREKSSQWDEYKEAA